MLDADDLVQQCRTCLAETDPQAAAREVLARAVSDPRRLLSALGEPTRGEVQVLYRGEDMAVLNVIWGPGMRIFPHDHRMWANIAIYQGCEDNTFWQRGERGLVRHGDKRAQAKEVLALGEHVIHSVSNPLDRITAAIHVYGGDFFGTPRSEWDPDTHEESRYDFEHTQRAFEEANARLASGVG